MGQVGTNTANEKKRLSFISEECTDSVYHHISGLL
jgi:hypothetical protein